MAFWGVEVKPGKPFIHLPGSTRERLHISQATLGFGTATMKSVVQCNVGNKSPVFLCSLFPEKSESCQLNLEFEEANEVVFSVIGPRSVHLTGYYLGASRHLKLDDESESYGEDILDTDQERSPGVSDEEYEDSFIDDDDLQVIPASPAFSDGAEETSHDSRKKDAKVKHKRLRKKYQISQTDESDDYASQQQSFSNAGTSIMDSEDEDMAVISSIVKSAAKTRKTGTEKSVDKDYSGATEGKTDAIIDSEPKKKPHESKKKVKKQPKEGEVRAEVQDEFFSSQALTWDKTQQNETTVDQSSQDKALMNGDAKESGNDKGESQLHVTVPSDKLISGIVELISGVVAKTGKRKKNQTKETNDVGAERDFSNVNREDQMEQDKARCENVEQDGSLKKEENQKQAEYGGEDQLHISLPSNDLGHGIVAKTGKRKKKQAKETKTLGVGADNPFNNGIGEDQSQPDEAKLETIDGQSGSENHSGKKKKKKRRIQENKEVDESMNTSALDSKENNANRKTKKASKTKKQDGKVAAS